MPEVKIKEIKKDMSSISLTAKVISIGEERLVQTKYGEARVADAIVEDDTGRITLTLWREQIDKVKEGNIIRIENGFVREFRGKLSINVAKNGRITVLKNK